MVLTLVRTCSRPQLSWVVRRLSEPRRQLLVLAGPRQVGMTTLVRQALAALDRPSVYATADGPSPPVAAWVDRQWDEANRMGRDPPDGAVLVLDEVQKIPAWSEGVKARWDADTAAGRSLRVVLLGSAPLLVQGGLGESLAGRFERVRLLQGSWSEVRDAFGRDIDRYVRFGGYPGAAPLVGEPARWAAYLRDALVETTLSRDVLLLTRVDQPALLRPLFDLACAYSAQELSCTKRLGRLQDAGNTTTLAHDLALLSGAGLVTGLQKHAGQVVRARGASPKLQVLDNALVTSRAGADPSLRPGGERWRRLVQSAVGAHLVRSAREDGIDVQWCRDGRDEVDFVVHAAGRVTGVEVKTTTAPGRGLAAFPRAVPGARAVRVGPGGMGLEEAVSPPARAWLG